MPAFRIATTVCAVGMSDLIYSVVLMPHISIKYYILSSNIFIWKMKVQIMGITEISRLYNLQTVFDLEGRVLVLLSQDMSTIKA